MSQYRVQIKDKGNQTEIYFTFESKTTYNLLKASDKLKRKNLTVGFIGFNDKLLTIKTVIDKIFKDAFIKDMKSKFESICNEKSDVDTLFDDILMPNFTDENQRKNYETLKDIFKGYL